MALTGQKSANPQQYSHLPFSRSNWCSHIAPVLISSLLRVGGGGAIINLAPSFNQLSSLDGVFHSSSEGYRVDTFFGAWVDFTTALSASFCLCRWESGRTRRAESKSTGQVLNQSCHPVYGNLNEIPRNERRPSPPPLCNCLINGALFLIRR